jgi:hypothetical protein
MCGCARRGTKPGRCNGHCRMMRSGSSCAVPTRKTRLRRDQGFLFTISNPFASSSAITTFVR